MPYVPEAENILETLKQKTYVWYVSAFYEMKSKKVFIGHHLSGLGEVTTIKIYRNVKQEGRSSETQRILRMAEDSFLCQPQCFIYMETKHRRNILRMKERSDSALGWHQGHT